MGMNKIEGGSLQTCIAKFQQKFKDKTGNEWRKPFAPKPGKYTLVS